MALLLAGVAGNALALDVPALRARVTDTAGVLDPTVRARLENKLAGYEQATGHQFAVLVVPSLEGEALEDYSMHVVEAWKLGRRKGNDDGLLLLIAVRDHKVRIEVGYGLEGRITDALSARIIRGVIAPAFQSGDFSGGIDRALDALMQAGRGEEPSPPRSSQSNDGSFPDPLGLLLIVIFLGGHGCFVAYAYRQMLRRKLYRGRSPPAFFRWYFTPRSRGGYGGFWSGGGSGSNSWSSGSSSGGGSFSGGGGSFGGGGASGSW